MLWRCDPTRVMASSFLRFLDYTQRRTIVGRTSLDEWSARRRDLYLTAHNTHNRQTCVPSVLFEPTISAGERPQTYALDRAATGTSCWFFLWDLNFKLYLNIECTRLELNKCLYSEQRNYIDVVYLVCIQYCYMFRQIKYNGTMSSTVKFSIMYLWRINSFGLWRHEIC